MRWPWQIKDVDLERGASAKWAWMTRYMIPSEYTDEYVHRLRVLQTPWFGIYVHDILSPDEQDLHDHPWWFYSLVLKGGYIELVADTRTPTKTSIRKRWPGSIVRVPLDHCHRIITVFPKTRTLLLVGPRARDWGFYTNEGWVYWREYKRLHEGENS